NSSSSGFDMCALPPVSHENGRVSLVFQVSDQIYVSRSCKTQGRSLSEWLFCITGFPTRLKRRARTPPQNRVTTAGPKKGEAPRHACASPVPHGAYAMRVPRSQISKGAAANAGFGSGIFPRCPAAVCGSRDKVSAAQRSTIRLVPAPDADFQYENVLCISA